MVRAANQDDFPRLLEMARHFYDASGYSEIAEFSEDTLLELFATLVASETSYLRRTEHGMLAGVAFPVFFDRNAGVAQELMWWVDPEGRKAGEGSELLTDFEDWAQSVGAKATMMLNLDALDADGLARLYRNRGYRPAEQSWMRVY